MSRAVRPRLLMTASLVLVFTLMLGACAGGGMPRQVSGVKLEYVEQREHLKALCRNITSLVITTCRAVERQSMQEGFADDRKVRRECAMWQTAVIEDCRAALDLDDPRRSMVDLWTLAYQYQALVEEGKVTREMFGAAEPTVAGGVARIVEITDQAAHEFFEPKQFESAKQGIREFLAKGPKAGEGARESYRPTFGGVSAGTNVLGDIIGTSQAAQAVDRIAIEADQGAWLAAWMPLMLRLQAQVLLMDMADVPLVVSLLEKFDQAQKAIVRLDEASQRLPKALEQTFVNVIDKVRADQGELRETISKADSTVAHARDAIADSKQVVEQVGAAVRDGQALVTAIERASKSLGPTVTAATKLVEDLTPVGVAEPSVAERLATIERAATQLASTTEAANNAVAGLRELLEKDGSLAAIDDTTQATIDHVFWRGVLLIAVVLAAAVVYRLVSVRVSR